MEIYPWLEEQINGTDDKYRMEVRIRSLPLLLMLIDHDVSTTQRFKLFKTNLSKVYILILSGLPLLLAHCYPYSWAMPYVCS